MVAASQSATFVGLVGPIEHGRDASGTATSAFVAAPHHLAADGQVDPAMLNAFATHVLGRAAAEDLGEGAVSMISLNSDFVGPVQLGERVEGRAAITRRTRSLVFLFGTIRAGGRVVVSANGIMKVIGA